MTSKSKSRVTVKCPECQYSFIPTLEEIQSRAGQSSRRKGHAFERRVAKALQEWWVFNKDGKLTTYAFRRSPQSGGSSLKQDWSMGGDIVTTADNFPAQIECKNAPGSFKGWHQLFTANKFAVWEWLEQIHKNTPANKIPLLIVNRFDQPTYCITTNSCVLKPIRNLDIDHLVFDSREKHPYIIIWNFDDMLKTDPNAWIDL